MILHQFSTLTIFFMIFINIQFITYCYKSQPKNFEDEEELKLAWKLNTGYVRTTQNLPSRVDIKEFKRIMTNDENKPTSFKLHNKSQIIYYNLYCSNLKNLLQYMSLIGSFEKIQILKENDKLLLNESIIKHMLALMLKTELDAPLDPLWAMLMYAIYIREQRNYLYGNLVIHFKDLIRVIIEILKSHAEIDCDINITNAIKTNTSDKYKIGEIKNVVHVMNKRNQNNSFYLNDIEVENWISLNKIYLNEVIKNKDILKTIIMHFGGQSQKIYNDIIEDINTAYKAARDCYWFDLWILKIRDYQKKVFDIFRNVALYFIRKHLSYSLFNKDNSNTIINNTYMYEFLIDNDTLNNIFKFKLRDIYYPLFLLSEKPSETRSYDDINSEIIKGIDEKIEIYYFVKSFNMSNEDDEDIKKSLKDKLETNFQKFNHFLEYLNSVYQKIDIKIVRSFIEYSTLYRYVMPPEDQKNEIKYLEF